MKRASGCVFWGHRYVFAAGKAGVLRATSGRDFCQYSSGIFVSLAAVERSDSAQFFPSIRREAFRSLGGRISVSFEEFPPSVRYGDFCQSAGGIFVRLAGGFRSGCRRDFCQVRLAARKISSVAEIMALAVSLLFIV